MSKDERLALETAAQPAMERIRGDRARCPAGVARGLEYIEEHLFDRWLSVSRLRTACRIGDNSWPSQFGLAVGVPPAAYIEDRRMETACHLIRETELELWKIGALVGYSSAGNFSRAFHRWAGSTALEFRRMYQGGAKPTPETWFTPQKIVRAVNGRLTTDEFWEMREHLETLYPSVFNVLKPARVAEADQDLAWSCSSRVDEVGAAGGDDRFARDPYDRIRAEETWRVIREWPYERQLELVKQRVRFHTAAFVDLLIEAYPREGRDDRGYGVQIAELALESLESIVHDGLDESQRANLTARVWAHVSNARRLSFDHLGAEKAMITAEKVLPTNPDLRTLAELWNLKSALRWNQRKHEEALELEEKAIEAFRAIGDRRQLTKTLINKAILLEAVNRPASGIPLLRESLTLSVKLSDSFLEFCACQNLVSLLLSSGDLKEAQELLPKMKELSRTVGGRLAEIQSLWLEGYIAQNAGEVKTAESCFTVVRDSSIEMKATGHAALATLDLALLFASQGRFADARTLVAETVSIFRSLGLARETTLGLSLLQELEATNRISESILQEARERLKGRLSGME